MADTSALDKLTRSELEDHARAVGVEDPASFRNMDELKAAILAAGAPSMGSTDAGVNSLGQDSGTVETQTNQVADTLDAQPGQRIGVYIVDGIEVDPNGVPLDSK